MTADSGRDMCSTPDHPRVRQRNQTAVGRARSAQNATRHGALSQQVAGDRETQQAFQALLEQLVSEFTPSTATELSLVQRLAILFWRERRLASTEGRMISGTTENGFPSGGLSIPEQLLVGRYQTMLGNQIAKTLDQIERVKKGFV